MGEVAERDIGYKPHDNINFYTLTDSQYNKELLLFRNHLRSA